jgi:glycosyltransferase involved in cell wall biosynthesis
MSLFGTTRNIADMCFAFFVSAAYRLLFFWRKRNSDCKIVLNYGSDLYALAVKGNLNHASQLFNPSGAFDKVYTVCFNPRALNLPREECWLIPVLVPRQRWRRIITLLRLCREARIGIFRARGPHEAAFTGLCLKIALRLPVILSTGGNHRLSQDLRRQYAFGSKWVSFFVEKMAYRYADLIYCINGYTRDIIQRLGGASSNRLVVNPIRIDHSIFDPATHDSASLRRKEGMDQNAKMVLFVGRLELDKQVEVLFEAIPLVLSELSEALFYVLGDGSLRHELEAAARAGGFADHVVFKGFTPNEGTARYYTMANVVCIPMSGFVVYEAAAMQKSIVAFDVDWHSEFIDDKSTGLLVPNRDVNALAKALLSLLKDTELAARLGQKARERFLNEYNPQMLEKREAAIIDGFCQRLRGA